MPLRNKPFRASFLKRKPVRDKPLRSLFKLIISCLWITILLIEKSEEQCSSTKYPVGLKANSLEVNYISMETHSSGDILLAGLTNNNIFFNSDTIASGSLGFPIFQFFDISTCSFAWSNYIPLNLEDAEVTVTYRSDYASIGFGFTSTPKTLTFGQMSLTGTLNRLWKSQSASSIRLQITDLLYNQNNDMMIAAYLDDDKCKIIYINGFGTSSGLSKYLVQWTKGQTFSLVFCYDTTYIWAVGRAVDSSNNEQAFLHLKLKKDDGDIMSAIYKQVASTVTGAHSLQHSDKKMNGDYLWSCGNHIDGPLVKAIYSVLASGNLFAAKQTSSSKCFGISGISATQAYAIRAKYPTTSTTNYFLSMLTYASSTFATTSYNMNTKIDTGISLQKAYPKAGSNIAYMIGQYQFSTSSDQQGYLMKMSTNFASPTYNTETCDAFTLALASDTPSLFEATNTWTNVGSPSNSLFSKTDTSLPAFTQLTSLSLKALILAAGTYSTQYSCTASPVVTIIPSTTINQNYDLGTQVGTTSYIVPAFTLSPSGASGTIVYSDAAPLSGVTFNSSSQTYNWSTLMTVGSYTLTMQGSLAGSTSVTTSFTLAITKSASPVDIQPQSVTNQNFTIHTGSPSSYIVPPFKTNPPVHESSILYQDVSTPLPTGVTFNQSTREYSWTNSTPVGVYPLTLRGSIASTSISPATVSITLTITAPHLIPSSTTAQQFDLNTLVGNNIYTVPAFRSVPAGIESMITYSDVSIAKPAAVIFSPSSRQYDWSGVTSTGTFTLIMEGFISGCVPVTTSFKVTITKNSQAFVFIPNRPPYFDPVLLDITIELGKSQVFKFPQIFDPDQGDSGSFLSLKLGAAFMFVSGGYPTLLIAPTNEPLHVGTFPISTTIKDTHNATATFKFQIIIQGIQAQTTNFSIASSQNQTNQPNNASSSASSTEAEAFQAFMFSLFGRTIVKKLANKNLKGKPLELSASLLSINNQGIATIAFNKDIYVVKNLTAIDSQVLGLKIIPGADSDHNDLNITFWNVTKMDQRKIIIKIEFQSLLKISMHEIRDQLQIELKNPQFIVDEETGDTIKPETIVRKRIPKQMPKDRATVMLQNVGPAAKSSLNAFMMSNFAIQLFMAASLQTLWGMISVMQIIVHMPLLNVQFPENAMFFYSLIIDISSFNLIPDSWMKAIKQNFFNFKEEEFDESFTKMGYQSESSIENLGSMFIYLLFLVGLVGFVLLLRLLNRYQRVKKVYSYLANIIFWNMILRMFLEGYMEYALTSLINIYKLQWDTRSNSFQSVFSIVIFAWVFTFPFLTWYILWKNSQKLKEQESVAAFGSTFMELRIESKSALLYNVIYMLRRLLFSVVTLALKKWPFAQIQILIFHCILLIIYNRLARPFENPWLNKIEIFNELCIMGAAYHLFFFTQYVDDPQLQYNVGWSMIGVTVLNIVVNMVVMGYASIQSLKIQYLKLKFKFIAWNMKRKAASKERAQIYSSSSANTQSKMIKKEEEIKLENYSLSVENPNKDEVHDVVEIESISSIQNNFPQQPCQNQEETDQKVQDQIIAQKVERVIRRAIQLQGNLNGTNDFNSSHYKQKSQKIGRFQQNDDFEETKDQQSALFQLPKNRGFGNKFMKKPIQTLQQIKPQVVDEEEFYNFRIKD